MTETAPRDPAKEERIFTSATHIFAALGYQNAKTEAIAADAGVSKGLIFHYFGSKANLYVETVRRTFAKITAAADYSVWQNAPDLSTMVTRALKYKIAMQLDYPDEFNLSMVAYANNSTLPPAVQKAIADIWTAELTNDVPNLIRPVIERLPRRPGINIDDIIKMITGITMIIGEQAKVLIQANPNIKIAEFDPIIADALKYIDILQHGFIDTTN